MNESVTSFLDGMSQGDLITAQIILAVVERQRGDMTAQDFLDLQSQIARDLLDGRPVSPEQLMAMEEFYSAISAEAMSRSGSSGCQTTDLQALPAADQALAVLASR